ncbi:hypothetical protein GCK72_008300 [Caenorhabditis remanei]|uniref:Uncharacterized protein n=1 Tax=Caenorhabditis remanei TaxID=31234 RepID=A0A6A5GZV0_CAERE|nr:hypothetical protein GCK72_008300 [Caenorhabditis remanei]KAF1760054.1 hypothetical protein GCK72_008300 [Caenorhabditis remanei]
MSTIFTTILLLLTIFFSFSYAQFFFPFAMGRAYQRPVSATGYQYSNGYGVKDSEGFFALCRGWTCTSNT